MLNGSAPPLVESPRDGQFIAWHDGLLLHSGWIVGETPDGEWFYVNAKTYDLSVWDWKISRQALVEEAHITRL